MQCLNTCCPIFGQLQKLSTSYLLLKKQVDKKKIVKCEVTSEMFNSLEEENKNIILMIDELSKSLDSLNSLYVKRFEQLEESCKIKTVGISNNSDQIKELNDKLESLKTKKKKRNKKKCTCKETD